MSGSPQFRYFLADPRFPMTPDHAWWKRSLPLNPEAGATHPSDASITYGDYFSAVRFFLSRNRFGALCATAAGLLKRAITPPHMKTIDVFLVKHGQYYHPARIDIRLADRRLSFAVNVAISQGGANIIEREYGFLMELERDFPYRFIPAVHFAGKGRTGRGRDLKMFLGEWLAGYREFHLTRATAPEKHRMAVWVDPRHHIFLSADQTFNVYRMAAMILTAYFNPESYRHIFPWHHAAGDFVIRTAGRDLDVKLITVRQYAPMFQDIGVSGLETDGIKALPQALLLFFLNTALRMRLDRLDGVGEMAWSDASAVAATYQGFFQGLDLMILRHGIPDDFLSHMRRFLASQTVSDMVALSRMILSTYIPGAVAQEMVQRQLPAHANDLRAICSRG